jgi:hypothetical protein
MMDDVNCLENFELGKDSSKKRGGSPSCCKRETTQHSTEKLEPPLRCTRGNAHLCVVCGGTQDAQVFHIAKKKRKTGIF